MPSLSKIAEELAYHIMHQDLGTVTDPEKCSKMLYKKLLELTSDGNKEPDISSGQSLQSESTGA